MGDAAWADLTQGDSTEVIQGCSGEKHAVLASQPRKPALSGWKSFLPSRQWLPRSPHRITKHEEPLNLFSLTCQLGPTGRCLGGASARGGRVARRAARSHGSAPGDTGLTNVTAMQPGRELSCHSPVPPGARRAYPQRCV